MSINIQGVGAGAAAATNAATQPQNITFDQLDEASQQALQESIQGFGALFFSIAHSASKGMSWTGYDWRQDDRN